MICMACGVRVARLRTARIFTTSTLLATAHLFATFAVISKLFFGSAIVFARPGVTLKKQARDEEATAKDMDRHSWM